MKKYAILATAVLVVCACSAFGQPSGGPGGARGPGGFGPGMMLAPQMFSQADKNGDQKLTKEEFTALADAWFDKMDSNKTGSLSQEQFMEGFNNVLPPPQGPGGAGQGPQGAPRFGPARFLGPAIFGVADADKNGSLTRAELKSTFEKWYGQWDSDNSGSLTQEKLRDGLNAVLPQPQFGGRSGRGGAGGPGMDNRGPGLEAQEEPSPQSRGARGGAPMGGRMGFGGGRGSFLNVEATNKAVAAIEEQLAAIKKAMEGAPMPGARGGPGGMGGGPGSGGDMQAMMEQMRKRMEAVQAAAATIAEQALVLKGQQARMEFQQGITELQSIAASANAEQATKTAQLVQGIIDARQKTFQETAAKLGIAGPGGRGGPGGGRGGGPGGMMGPGMGGGQPPIKGGFEWID